MIERMCPKCRVPMNSEKCINPNCDCTTVASSTIYWCNTCNIPIFERQCTCCGEEGEYITTDIRPVFPEEKLLLALLKGLEYNYYDEKSVWYGSNFYIVDGKKEKIVLSKINNWTLSKIKEIKDEYDSKSGKIDYSFFESMIQRFVKANKERYNYITEEAITYIQSYKDRYNVEDMLVSFSGGKDSLLLLVSNNFDYNFFNYN